MNRGAGLLAAITMCAAIACGDGYEGGSGGAVGGVVGSAVSTVGSGFFTDCSSIPPFAPAIPAAGDAVTVDVDLRCQSAPIGQAGLSIAVSETRTFVAAAGGSPQALEVTAGRNVLFDAAFFQGPIAMVSSSDNVDLMALVGINTNDPGYALNADWGYGFPTDPLPMQAATSMTVGFIDADLSPAGILRSWHFVDADRSTVHQATVDLPEFANNGEKGPTFTTHAVAGAPGIVRVAVAADGRTVTFNATPTPGELLAVIDGETRTIRAPGAHGAADYRVARPPRAFVDGPDHVVSILDDEGLHVAAANATEILLADTAPWTPTCDVGGAIPVPSGGCPAACHELAVGVIPRSHAIARLPGNAVLVAYVVLRADYLTGLALSNDQQRCEPAVTEDDSRYDLVLARVDLGTGVVTEHLRTPVGRFPDADEGTGDAIDIATFDHDVGLVVRGEDGKGWKARAMRIVLGD